MGRRVGRRMKGVKKGGVVMMFYIVVIVIGLGESWIGGGW